MTAAMLKACLRVLGAAAVLSTASRVEADVWVSNGPGGGEITALAIDPASPTTIYAGTRPGFGSGGVFKSTDAGTTWRAVNTGLTSPRIRALAIDPAIPGTLYAGTDGGVFKSTDAGGTWVAVISGLLGTLVNEEGLPGIGAIAIDPTTPNTLYAASETDVFKSTDGGATWSATGLVGGAHALAIDPMSPSTVYAGRSGAGGIGVFKSTDGGGTWSAVLARPWRRWRSIPRARARSTLAAAGRSRAPTGVDLDTLTRRVVGAEYSVPRTISIWQAAGEPRNCE